MKNYLLLTLFLTSVFSFASTSEKKLNLKPFKNSEKTIVVINQKKTLIIEDTGLCAQIGALAVEDAEKNNNSLTSDELAHIYDAYYWSCAVNFLPPH